MSNVPAGDPGVRLVPFIQTFCEWLVTRAGKIATCVESAEMVCDHVATHGRIPVTPAEDNALADDLLARGEASPNGATNSDAASAQMARLGIPNTHMHQAAGSFDWIGMIKRGVDRGVASIYGFNQAHLTVDTWTGQATNQGVFGHGVAIVGYDDSGAIVADPNTAQAENGNFVHYTWDNLAAAASGSPDVVTPEVSMGTPLDGYFTIANGTYTLKSDPSISFGGAEAALFVEVNGAIGLPLEPMNYTKQSQFYTGFCFRRYERGIVVYDPQHKLDAEPGFGDFYLAHLDKGPFAIAQSDDEAAESAQLAALQADTAAKAQEIESLKAQLAAVKPTPASVSVALQAAASALAPFAAVAADVAQAQKDLGA